MRYHCGDNDRIEMCLTNVDYEFVNILSSDSNNRKNTIYIMIKNKKDLLSK